MKVIRKLLIIAGIVIVLTAIAVGIAAALFDINSQKPRIQTAVSKTTGFDVKINGKMTLFLSPFGISAKDIHVSAQKNEFLAIDRIKIGVALRPLLKRQFEVTGCELVKPIFTIVQDANGRYNFEKARKTPTAKGTPRFRLRELKISNGEFLFKNRAGDRTEGKALNLVIRNLVFAGPSPRAIKNVSFTGDLDCKEVHQKSLLMENLESAVKADKGVISFNPFYLDIFDARGQADLTIDASAARSTYVLNLKIPKLDFAKLIKAFSAKEVMSGKGDLSAALTLKPVEGRIRMNGLNGVLSLSGDNLVTNTIDLDKVISSLKTTRELNLVDLGGFFVAGPLSIVARQGYGYGNVYYGAVTGKGSITQFLANWNISNGVANAMDCALATRQHRVALKGKLDFISNRYQGVTVALLDEKGCALFKQDIQGSFANPRIGAVSTVESLIGPLSDVYQKTRRLFETGGCKAFYTGSVQQPR